MTRELASPFVKFLGTGGARFVMTRQLRSTGGFWVGYRETFLHVDPGPGALVRCHASRPPLKPERLTAVVLSHRHIDHCNDASVLVEAMTLAGTKRQGAVFCPEDCLSPHSVLFPHVLEFLPGPPTVLRAGQRHSLGDIVLSVPLRHRHPVETYGFVFEMGDVRLAYVADTAFFEDLIPAYRDCDVVILNVTLAQPKPGVQHLSLPEAFELTVNLNARVTVLTHFGMEVLRAKPWQVAQEWSRKTGRTVLAAEDGRYFDLTALLEKRAGGSV